MSRITKALEKLRVKCTEAGAHPNGKGVADILECIAEHYAGGGGGGDIFIVNMEMTEPAEEGEMGTIVADKTADETLAAYEAGKLVFAKIKKPDNFEFLCDLASASENYNSVGHRYFTFEEDMSAMVEYIARFGYHTWTIDMSVINMTNGEEVYSASYTEQ